MTARAPWTPSAGTDDRTRERATGINQLLMGLVALVATVVMAVTSSILDVNLLSAGVVVVFLATGVAVAVPWNRLPAIAIAVLPAVDIVAIALLEMSSPASGFALLWVFPALWLASSFGLFGLIFGSVSVSAAFWISSVAVPSPAFRPTMVLVPLAIAAIAFAGYLTSRRSNAQRLLLSKQGEALKRTLDRARRQEVLVTEVLDAVDFGVVRIDADGTTPVANDAHARLQGVAGGDPASARKLYGADGVTPLEAGDEPIARAREGETFESELIWYGAPGTRRRALSVTARRLRGTNAAGDGALVVFRDVTAEVSALRAREDLIASVSHELRTPLTSILGYLDLVLDTDDLPAPARGNLEVVERNANRLLTIVADILAASADARGGVALSFHREDTDLTAIVHAALEAIEAQADARNLTIDATAVERVSAWVDPVRIRQVVDNLLSNAVKYHRDGGSITVSLTADIDDGWIVVRDDGPGIPADELPMLFDRFYRADAVRNTSTHGSGLGLAISQEIVRKQGGDITVRSVEGEGSTFTVRIPLRKRRRSA